MPNTLAHIGIQTVLQRSVAPRVQLRWVVVAAAIPDIPWILQRAAATILPSVDIVDLRSYAIIQSSLFFCIILSIALGAFAERFTQTSAILVSGSFLHLILDAMQTKWANGAQFFAPFDWDVVNWGVFCCYV